MRTLLTNIFTHFIHIFNKCHKILSDSLLLEEEHFYIPEQNLWFINAQLELNFQHFQSLKNKEWYNGQNWITAWEMSWRQGITFCTNWTGSEQKTATRDHIPRRKFINMICFLKFHKIHHRQNMLHQLSDNLQNTIIEKQCVCVMYKNFKFFGTYY